MNGRPLGEIESPAGLDLNPEPPVAVRLSKRAGLLGLIIVGIVVALIGWGIVTRRDRAVQMVSMDETRGLTAATDAGQAIAAQVPPGVLTVPQGEELEPPETGTRETGNQAASPGGWQRSAPPPSYASTPPPAYREPSPEEKRRVWAFQQEMEAIEAPTSARAGFGGIGGGSARPASLPSPEGDLSQMTALLNAMRGSRSRVLSADVPLTGQGVGDGEDHAAQNMQEQKSAFLAQARGGESDSYLASKRERPLGKYEIKAGWDIPAVLEQALNSDLPGEVRALVRENVYDTATGNYLLIPQGSRLVGVYDSRIAYGQDGVMVVWNRIIFPDGSSVNLEGMASQDAGGQSGLRHKVDNHYRRLIGFAVLTSGFSAAFQLSQSPRAGLLGYPSAAEMAGTAVGRELSQFGAQVTRRNLNVQPTIKVPIGYRFNVRVNRHMLFDGPYRL
jgi:type IV secretion system protein TrbI